MRVLMSRVGSATLKEPWDGRQDRLGSRPAMRTGPQLLLLDKLHPESLRFTLSSRLCYLYQRARQSWVSLSRDGSLPAPTLTQNRITIQPCCFLSGKGRREEDLGEPWPSSRVGLVPQPKEQPSPTALSTVWRQCGLMVRIFGLASPKPVLTSWSGSLQAVPNLIPGPQLGNGASAVTSLWGWRSFSGLPCPLPPRFILTSPFLVLGRLTPPRRKIQVWEGGERGRGVSTLPLLGHSLGCGCVSLPGSLLPSECLHPTPPAPGGSGNTMPASCPFRPDGFTASCCGWSLELAPPATGSFNLLTILQ